MMHAFDSHHLGRRDTRRLPSKVEQVQAHISLQGEFMIRKNLRILAAAFLAANLAVVTPTGLLAEPQHGGGGGNHNPTTTTPIKHLVVIFQENVSFDHYFATYPVAANPAGESQFTAKPHTP